LTTATATATVTPAATTTVAACSSLAKLSIRQHVAGCQLPVAWSSAETGCNFLAATAIAAAALIPTFGAASAAAAVALAAVAAAAVRWPSADCCRWLRRLKFVAVSGPGPGNCWQRATLPQHQPAALRKIY